MEFLHWHGEFDDFPYDLVVGRPAQPHTRGCSPADDRFAAGLARRRVADRAPAHHRRREMTDQIKYLLDETEIPRTWYNIAADLPGLAPALHPGTGAPITVDDLTARSCRRRLVEQELSQRAGDRDPRAGAADLRAVAADAVVPRSPAGARAGHPRADLLQVRGRQPGGQPQAEHRDRAGVLQQAGRHHASSSPRPAPASGARRCRFAGALFGLKVTGLHGQGQLPPEALPPAADGDLRRARACRARAPRPRPAGRSSPRTRTAPAASASPRPRRSRSRWTTPTTELRGRQRAQPRAAAPER